MTEVPLTEEQREDQAKQQSEREESRRKAPRKPPTKVPGEPSSAEEAAKENEERGYPAVASVRIRSGQVTDLRKTAKALGAKLVKQGQKDIAEALAADGLRPVAETIRAVAAHGGAFDFSKSPSALKGEWEASKPPQGIGTISGRRPKTRESEEERKSAEARRLKRQRVAFESPELQKKVGEDSIIFGLSTSEAVEGLALGRDLREHNFSMSERRVNARLAYHSTPQWQEFAEAMKKAQSDADRSAARATLIDHLDKDAGLRASMNKARGYAFTWMPRAT